MYYFYFSLQTLPAFSRVVGLKIPGDAFADLLMVQEFVHNFSEALELGKKIWVLLWSKWKSLWKGKSLSFPLKTVLKDSLLSFQSSPVTLINAPASMNACTVACQCLCRAKSLLLHFPSFLLLSIFFDNLAKVAIHCYTPSLWTFVFEPKTMKSSDPVSLHVLWNFVYCQASFSQMYLYIQGKSVRVVNHPNLPLNLVIKMFFLPYRFQRSPFLVGNAIVIVKWQQWGCPCATLSEPSDVCIRGSWLWGAWCESCFHHCHFCLEKLVVVSLQNSASAVNVPGVLLIRQ